MGDVFEWHVLYGRGHTVYRLDIHAATARSALVRSALRSLHHPPADEQFDRQSIYRPYTLLQILLLSKYEGELYASPTDKRAYPAVVRQIKVDYVWVFPATEVDVKGK